MAETVLLALVICSLITLGLRWRETHIEQRETRKGEQLAAVVLYEEIEAAIGSMDLALGTDRSNRLLSMSQSPMLTKAWREHGEALLGLGAERWGAIADAVCGVAPESSLDSPADLQGFLIQRRELLMKGATILRSVREP